MKRLVIHNLDPNKARAQLNRYENMMLSRAELLEQQDILPFFRSNLDLSLLFSHYIPAIRNPDSLASEFLIYGDFRADLLVGDQQSGKYLLVEFEDGTSKSIFLPGAKTALNWAPRFERAFSQIVDWLWKLEDMRTTNDFAHVFGRRDVVFSGLIVTGKNMNLSLQEKHRLKWREDKIRVDSKAISVVSYDDFLEDANAWLKRFYQV